MAENNFECPVLNLTSMSG